MGVSKELVQELDFTKQKDAVLDIEEQGPHFGQDQHTSQLNVNQLQHSSFVDDSGEEIEDLSEDPDLPDFEDEYEENEDIIPELTNTLNKNPSDMFLQQQQQRNNMREQVRIIDNDILEETTHADGHKTTKHIQEGQGFKRVEISTDGPIDLDDIQNAMKDSGMSGRDQQMMFNIANMLGMAQPKKPKPDLTTPAFSTDHKLESVTPKQKESGSNFIHSPQQQQQKVKNSKFQEDQQKPKPSLEQIEELLEGDPKKISKTQDYQKTEVDEDRPSLNWWIIILLAQVIFIIIGVVTKKDEFCCKNNTQQHNTNESEIQMEQDIEHRQSKQCVD